MPSKAGSFKFDCGTVAWKDTREARRSFRNHSRSRTSRRTTMFRAVASLAYIKAFRLIYINERVEDVMR